MENTIKKIVGVQQQRTSLIEEENVGHDFIFPINSVDIINIFEEFLRCPDSKKYRKQLNILYFLYLKYVM